jgi:hypothetical protein
MTSQIKTFGTPTIPRKFREFAGIEFPKGKNGLVRRWVNAFSDDFVGAKANNLYATETLFGDWGGQVFLLAQDALPARALVSLLEQQTARGISREEAWAHAERGKLGHLAGYRSNEIRKSLMAKYLPNTGALYGSATANLLFDDGHSKYSRYLYGFRDPRLYSYFTEVFLWTVRNMANLRAIVCLGDKAWSLTMDAMGVRSHKSFMDARNAQKIVEFDFDGRRLSLIPAYHPAARCAFEEKAKTWQLVAGVLHNR